MRSLKQRNIRSIAASAGASLTESRKPCRQVFFGSLSVVRSIGASPKEAGRQFATIADSSGLQRGRIHGKCTRNS